MSARINLPVVAAVDSFEQPDVCTPCGGNCCKSMPGCAMPADFGAAPDEMRARLVAALATGKWAVDWWEGDPTLNGDDDVDRAYFVRPATTKTTALFDPTWGGPCVFHGAKGCEIFDERPSGCRGLEPNPPKCHVRHSSKRDAAIAWLPFHRLILEAADLAGDRHQ